MKGTITSVTAALMVLVASGAHAHEFYQAFNGNPDLYSGQPSSLSVPTGLYSGHHDFYAGILEADGFTFCPVLAQVGSGDDFGSSLLDIGHQIRW